MKNWYIDSWDRRSGRAFASHREPDNTNENGGIPKHLEQSLVYISPPNFQPEIITNPSVALAFARAGSVDPRLPLDTGADEIGFPSPYAVAEFTRRAFIGSGGGRGGEGNTPTPEGGPVDGPPDSPDSDNQAGELAEYLKAFEIKETGSIAVETISLHTT